MLEWSSPDRAHTATWKWGGELWMSGPEWGWLSFDNHAPISGATPDPVAWSPDGRFAAFVKLHIEDVPSRQGTEGMSFRVCIIRLADHQLRYCLGNQKLAEVTIEGVTSESISLIVNGQQRVLSLEHIKWENHAAF